MGDFNATNNPMEDRSEHIYSSTSIPPNPNSNTTNKRNRKRNWKPEIPIFSSLEDLNIFDTQKNWELSTSISNQLSFTWSNQETSSRIDYIWISFNLIQNHIHSFSNIDFNHITNSDHTLLQIKLYLNNLINCTKNVTTKKRDTRTIFDFKSMDQEKWAIYAQEIDESLIKKKIMEQINNHSKPTNHHNNNPLQMIWDQIESSIKSTRKKKIPTKKIKRMNKPIFTNKGHTPSFKNLRKAIYILALSKKLQKNPDQITLDQLHKEIKNISKIYPTLDFSYNNNFPHMTETQWTEWKNLLKNNIKSIKEVNYREEATIKEKDIKKAIQTRCQDLLSNQKKMIDSLTDRKRNSIILNRILIKDSPNPYISTDVDEILETTKKILRKGL